MLAKNQMAAMSLTKRRLLQMRHLVANGANESIRAFGLQPLWCVDIKTDNFCFEIDVPFHESGRALAPLSLDKAQL